MNSREYYKNITKKPMDAGVGSREYFKQITERNTTLPKPFYMGPGVMPFTKPSPSSVPAPTQPQKPAQTISKPASYPVAEDGFSLVLPDDEPPLNVKLAPEPDAIVAPVAPRQYSDYITQMYSPEEIQQITEQGKIGAGETITDPGKAREAVDITGFAGLQNINQLRYAANRLQNPNIYKEENPQLKSGEVPFSSFMGIGTPQFQRDGKKLRENDLKLLGEYLSKMAEAEIRGRTAGSYITEGVMQLPGFMGQMIMTGPGASIGKEAVKKYGAKALKKFGKKKVVAGAIKLGTRTTSMGVSGTLRTLQMPQLSAAKAAQRMLPKEMYIAPKGELIVSQAGEKPFEAVWKGIADTIIQFGTEEAGSDLARYAGKIPVAGKLFRGLKKAFQTKYPGGKAGAFNDVLKAGGLNSFLGEMGEEELGRVLQAATGVEDFGAKDPESIMSRLAASSPDAQQLLIEAAVLAVPTGGRAAVNIAAQGLENRRAAKEAVVPQPPTQIPEKPTEAPPPDIIPETPETPPATLPQPPQRGILSDLVTDEIELVRQETAAAEAQKQGQEDQTPAPPSITPVLQSEAGKLLQGSTGEAEAKSAHIPDTGKKVEKQPWQMSRRKATGITGNLYYSPFRSLVDLQSDYRYMVIPKQKLRDAEKLFNAIDSGDIETVIKIENKYYKAATKGEGAGVGPKPIKYGETISKRIGTLARLGRGKLEQHKQSIQQAVSESKPVPLEVLQEYAGEKWADDAINKLGKLATPELEAERQKYLKIARKNAREHLAPTEKKTPAVEKQPWQKSEREYLLDYHRESWPGSPFYKSPEDFVDTLIAGNPSPGFTGVARLTSHFEEVLSAAERGENIPKEVLDYYMPTIKHVIKNPQTGLAKPAYDRISKILGKTVTKSQTPAGRTGEKVAQPPAGPSAIDPSPTGGQAEGDGGIEAEPLAAESLDKTKPVTGEMETLLANNITVSAEEVDRVPVETVTEPGEQIKAEQVKRIFPGAQVTNKENGYEVDLPDGRKIVIERMEQIEPDPEQLEAGHAKTSLAAGEQVAGMWQLRDGATDGIVDNQGIIQLAGIADIGTLAHESFHAAMDMVLTDKQKKAVLKKFGTEENAAEAYRKYLAGKPGNSLFEKIKRFFRMIYEKLIGPTATGTYEKVRTGKAWKQAAGRKGAGAAKYQTKKGPEGEEKKKGKKKLGWLEYQAEQQSNFEKKYAETEAGAVGEEIEELYKAETLESNAGLLDARTGERILGKKEHLQRIKEMMNMAKKQADKTAQPKENYARQLGQTFKQIGRTLIRAIEPSRAVDKLDPKAYASIVEFAHLPEAEKVRWGFNEIAELGDMTYNEFHDLLSDLTDQQAKDILLVRGKPFSEAGKIIQMEARGRVEKNQALKIFSNTMQKIYDSNYELLQAFGFEAEYVKEYFYGAYKNAKDVERYIDMATGDQLRKTTRRFLKQKLLTSYADAVGFGLELTDVNPMENAARELGGIARLAAMSRLKRELLTNSYGSLVINSTEASVDQIKNWVGFKNEQQLNGLLFHPDVGQYIRNMIAVNKTSTGALRIFRNMVHTLNGFKFLIPFFHLRTIVAQATVDTGVGGFLMPWKWKNMVRFKKDDPTFKTAEYLEYIQLGASHHYSVESESRRMLNQLLTDKKYHFTWRAARTPLRLVTAAQRSINNFVFERYIPAVKYAKYLQQVAAWEKRTGQQLTKSQKIKIIKEGQNFYGEMNERLFGRSATMTSALRFVFLAPGFREGNYRTMFKAASVVWDKEGGPGGRAWRSALNIPQYLLFSWILAQIGTLIMTGDTPEFPEDEDEFRDQFKVKTNWKDHKNRPVYIDLMTSERDYFEQLVKPAWQTVTGRPLEAAGSAANTFTKTLGGMKSTVLGLAKDVATISMREPLVNWKTKRVYYITDPAAKKLLKIGLHLYERIEPIPASTARRLIDKKVDPFLAMGIAMAGIRTSMPEIERKRNEIWSQLYSFREQKMEINQRVRSGKYTLDDVREFNQAIDEIIRHPAVDGKLRKLLIQAKVKPSTVRR